MNNENYHFQVASCVLYVLLLTGDADAATLVLQELFLPVYAHLSNAQFLVEVHAVMSAYHILLSQLDIVAAAKRPEFIGLRKLIKQVAEEQLRRKMQTA